jgi:hypothetical protein
MSGFTPEVAAAIEELGEDFTVSTRPTGDGGAIVTAHDIDIGGVWQPDRIDIQFVIPYNYPFPQIYPFYTESAISRAHGGQLPSALATVGWDGKSVTQISLRPNRWNPSHDTATGALEQVRHWFRSQG